jgi:hypothetical protein
VPVEREFKVVSPEWEQWDTGGRQGPAPKKQKPFTLCRITKQQLDPLVFTASGMPSTSGLALRALVGKPGTAAKLLERWAASESATGAQREAELLAVRKDAESRIPLIYKAFGGERIGLEAAAAIDALCEASAIETLLTNFILPLQVRKLAACA